MLDEGDQGEHAALAEVRQELVELEGQVVFLRHRIHVPVEAVQDDHPRAPTLHRRPDVVGKLPG